MTNNVPVVKFLYSIKDIIQRLKIMWKQLKYLLGDEE